MNHLRKQLIQQQYHQIWHEAQSDPEYAQLYAQMAELEPKYESVMEQLPWEVQDIIRDYVNQCEDMSRRILEFACEKMLFANMR